MKAQVVLLSCQQLLKHGLKSKPLNTKPLFLQIIHFQRSHYFSAQKILSLS